MAIQQNKPSYAVQKANIFRGNLKTYINPKLKMSFIADYQALDEVVALVFFLSGFFPFFFFLPMILLVTYLLLFFHANIYSSTVSVNREPWSLPKLGLFVFAHLHYIRADGDDCLYKKDNTVCFQFILQEVTRTLQFWQDQPGIFRTCKKCSMFKKKTIAATTSNNW